MSFSCSSALSLRPLAARIPAFVAAKREEYERDIDIVRLASELVVDAVITPGELRGELVARFAAAASRDRHFSTRRHGVPPV